MLLRAVYRRAFSSMVRACHRRSYHSYPDPNEKPIVTATLSNKQRVGTTEKKVEAMDKFKMTEMFPGSLKSTGISKWNVPETEATKLGNGLRVVSHEMHGQMTSVTLLMNVGSAHETQDTYGATHLTEILAFHSTKTRSRDELSAAMEQLGGIMQCVSSRDCIMYCIDVLRENIEPAMDILADCVMNPLLPAEEVDEALAVVQYQHLELPSQVLSRDAANRAAYLGSPLGNHHFYPIDSIKDFDVARIHSFRKQFLVGENCILAGAGIDHQLFLSLAQKRFLDLPSSATGGGATSLKSSKYTGGLVLDQRELKDNEFMRIAVAFEIGGWHDKDLVPACVLQTLLGGGSSFSAGGPGKGMYTRLYTEALNRYSWVEAAESFVTLTSESGLFGIDGACHTNRLPHMTQLFIDHIAGLQSVPVSDIELSRAKNMLKSLLLMQLESRLVLCEDIARQYAQYGFRENPAAVCKKVDEVTKEDIMRVAKRMMASDPAIGVVGCDLSQMPPYELIKSYATSLRAPM